MNHSGIKFSEKERNKSNQKLKENDGEKYIAEKDTFNTCHNDLFNSEKFFIFEITSRSSYF